MVISPTRRRSCFLVILFSLFVITEPARADFKILAKAQWQEGGKPIPLSAVDDGFAFLNFITAAMNKPGTGDVRLLPGPENQWTLSGETDRFFRVQAKVVGTPVRAAFASVPDLKHWKRGDQQVKLIHKNDGFPVLAGVGGVFKDRFCTVRVYLHSDGNWYLEGNSKAIGTRGSALVYTARKPGTFQAAIKHTEWREGRIKLIHQDEGFCFLSGISGNFNGGGRQVWVDVAEDGFWYVNGKNQGGKGVFVAWATSVRFQDAGAASNTVATTPAPTQPMPAKASSNPTSPPRPVPSPTAPTAPTPVTPPVAATPSGEIIADMQLEAPFDSFGVGGSGRYLVFHYHAARMLRVFDIVTQKIVGETTLAADSARFAAGLSKLMVVLPEQKLMQRYRLPDLQREVTKPLNLDDFVVSKCLMGNASQGPLLLWGKASGLLWDIDAMKPLRANTFGGHPKWGLNITVSGDGQTFLGWVDSGSGGKLNMMRIVDGKTEFHPGFGGIYGQSQIQPNRDASFMYTHNGAVLSAMMQKLPVGTLKDAPLFPTEDPRFFYRCRGWGDTCTVEICTAADRQIVFTHTGLPEFGKRHTWDITNPRIRFVPSARQLVVLPVSNDSVVIRRLDVLGELKKQERVVVYSQPPTFARRGTLYDYQIQAVSRAGGFKYELTANPAGMKIDERGRLTWRILKPPAEDRVPVLVTVTDAAGQEALHAFDVFVTRNPTVVATAPKPAERPAPASTPAPTVPPRTVEVVDDAIRHKLVAPQARLSYGLAGRSILLLDGKQLRVLNATGEKVVRTHDFPVQYNAMFERPAYYVGLAAKQVDLLDKKSLAVRKSIPIEYSKLRSLAIHPTKTLCYVAVDNPTIKDYVQSKPVLEVNEATGAVRVLPDVYGSWLAIDPAGQRLFTGLREMFKRGFQFLNGRLADAFDTIDYVTAYDLRGPSPTMLARNENPGKNGKRLVMAPDGRHVSYVAGGGAPGYGYSIASLAADDVKRESSRYVVDAYPIDIAHHPTANLVACAHGNSVSDLKVSIYDRHTGELLNDRLQYTGKFKGLVDVFFAPSGTHLLVTHDRGGLVVQPVALKLTDADRAAIAKGFPSSSATPAGTRPAANPVVRTWTDSSGKFTIQASLVKVTGDRVTLKRVDGRVATLPLSRLSAGDQTYLQRRAAPGASPRPTPSPSPSAPATSTAPAAKPSVAEALAALQRDLPDELDIDDGQIIAVEVGVTKNKLTDAHLRFLSACAELRYLEMGECPRITNTGLGWLSHCKRLREIYFNEARLITDEGIAHLRELPDLAELTVLCPNLTNASLEHVKHLPKLKELWVSGSAGINDAGLVHLKDMHQLTDLCLENSSVTGSGFVHIKGLTNLETLDLVYTQVNDAALVHLYGLKKLYHINLKQTKVTPAGAKRLQQALPKCEVLFTE